ncbi:MAG TPA: permease [Pyrinomonadaceae bacterium]|jgi:hypothetical protein
MSLSREAENAQGVEISDPRPVYAALLLLIIVGGLIAYKATASLAVIEKVQATGLLKPRFDLIRADAPSSWVSAFNRTLSYFAAVWPALLFGVLIGGAVRAFVSPRWLAGLFGGGRVRPQLVAGLAGAPLMLCSCCVAPVFTSVYERSSRLAPSLAFMLAAPSLNPAALILTFMLFGGRVGAVRLLMSGLGVLAIGLVAEHFAGGRKPVCEVKDNNGSGPNRTSAATAFLASCLKIAAQTVPLILAGVVISMLIARWLPVSGLGAATQGVAAVMITALISVPLAMPTFFEIPLALMLIASGMPAGAAVALLIAGPTTNLPSLLTIGRAAGWRAPALVAVMVWALAVCGGLLAGLL